MKKEFDIIIGKYIVSCRKAKGYNQAKFADKADIMINTLSKIERGESDFRISSLRCIVKGLGISFTEFFKGFENYEENDSPTFKKIFDYLKNEDEETIEFVFEQIKNIISFKKNKSH